MRHVPFAIAAISRSNLRYNIRLMACSFGLLIDWTVQPGHWQWLAVADRCQAGNRNRCVRLRPQPYAGVRTPDFRPQRVTSTQDGGFTTLLGFHARTCGTAPAMSAADDC